MNIESTSLTPKIKILKRKFGNITVSQQYFINWKLFIINAINLKNQCLKSDLIKNRWNRQKQKKAFLQLHWKLHF